MAIVFVKQSKKEIVLWWASLLVLLVFLLAIAFFLFSSQIIHFNKTSSLPIPESNLTINFEVIDSDQFKNLQMPPETQIEFNYIAQDSNGEKIVGSIVATSREAARQTLMEMNLKVSSLEEKNIGRLEPFTPYQ